MDNSDAIVIIQESIVEKNLRHIIIMFICWGPLADLAFIVIRYLKVKNFY